MAHEDEYPVDIMVCVDCALVLANGEAFDAMGFEVTQDILADIHTTWGAGVDLVLGDPEDVDNFSSADCEGCGSKLAGERYPATAFVKVGV